ncbi:hypothetical protein TSAR_015563 [Trichomalopsis sarcophagae]|uniref:Uncharacterized protein n=1 Tax=Trichomalopsis sarcophagae TaxID=543379 RepID=A0A232ENE4_9HYME|nr:hypothetical protein TSAR_015563 [Trichomalopsis sarcophagae]
MTYFVKTIQLNLLCFNVRQNSVTERMTRRWKKNKIVGCNVSRSGDKGYGWILGPELRVGKNADELNFWQVGPVKWPGA